MELGSLLVLAFGLGLLHALDADHVVAVTGLSINKHKNSIRYCTRWAVGHASALLVIGGAVLFLGMAIPESLSRYAEILVGFVLIALGTYIIWDIFRQRAHLHFHAHDGMPQHAHWHSHKHLTGPHTQDNHQHSHTPVFVGLLHGMAGSAPLLALLPLTQMSPWAGFTYLALFGLGVFFAMLIFGGLLGQAFTVFSRWGNQLINGLRFLVSAVAIGYGAKLLVVTLS